MAKWSIVLVLALVVVHAGTRNVPASDAGLNDQKNFLTYGGIGGDSGIGANGMPIGGVGSVGAITGPDRTGGVGGLVGMGFGGGAGASAGGGAAGGVGGGAGTRTGTDGGVIHFP